MKRFILLSLLSVFYICHSSAQEVTTHYFDQDELVGAFFNKVSDNGKYVVGSFPNSLGSFIYFMETDELVMVPVPDEDNPGSDLNDISDDGIAVGKFTDPAVIDEKNGLACLVPGIYDYRTQTWTALERPEGTIAAAYGYMASGVTISADGKLIGGGLPVENKKYVYNPVIWNGDGTIRSIVAGPLTGDGSKFSAMSDDGRVACGWTDGSQYGKVGIWKDGELVLNNKKGNGSAVSPNGKYVGGRFLDGKNDFGWPFIWTEETGIVKVNCPDTVCAGAVIDISNNGRIAVGYVDYKGLTDHHPFIIVDGEYYDFDEYMWTNFQVKGPMDQSFWAIEGMSADGSVISGVAYIDGARLPWIIKFNKAMSVNSQKEEPAVKVYPNPASDVLNIEGEYTSATLYDNLGTCVLQDTYSAGKLNISTLPEGMYLVKVVKGRTTQTFKIAVNH